MFPKRYNFKSFSKAVTNPSMVSSEFRRIFHRYVGKTVFNQKYGAPLEVMSQDWDNLILLDGCRYDLFSEYNSIEGELSPVVSSGSHSREFINTNFNGRKLWDTVYLTANPHADKTLEDNVFHKIIKTYSVIRIQDWDFEHYHPERVTDIALESPEYYKNKRLIVHYMQPHTPYLGNTAERVRDRLRENGLRFTFTSDSVEGVPEQNVYKSILKAARDGHVPADELKQCYIENLNIVLSEVKRLLTQIDGKTVISSDHGELLGNPQTGLPVHQKYDHTGGLYLPELRIVPWLVVDDGERRKITSEKPIEADKADRETVEEQLAALGYTN